YVIGQAVTTQVRMQQRATAPMGNQGGAPDPMSAIDLFVSTYFDEKRFGVEGEVRAKLRHELMSAGYFHVEAIKYYVLARVAAVAVLPIGAYILVELFLTNQHWVIKFGLIAIAISLAVLGPGAYLVVRQRRLHKKYRLAFPDMLDLLVVCVDAGLSLDAAF